MVPTVASVHFLNLKALVCILISMGSPWDIATKYVCHTTGFWVSNVYSNNSYNMYNKHHEKSGGKIKQWHDCRANDGVLAGQLKIGGQRQKSRHKSHCTQNSHPHHDTPSMNPPPCAHCRLHIPPPPSPSLFLPPPFPPDFCQPQFGASKCGST